MSMRNNKRRVSIRTVRRDPPDLRKLGQALIALAVARAEADAEAEHDNNSADEPDSSKKRRGP